MKYDQITIPGIGGGAESTTATVVGQSTIHDARAEQDFPSHWLVAHEAAHQWWGNLVTMRTWSHTWINESFATYGEYLFSKHDLGEDEGALNLLEKKNAYLREARNRYMRPVVFDRYVFPNDNFDSHTYPKGAVVLHTLRWIMGDQPFRRAMSHFLHRHAFQAVDTYQLMTAIKDATGQNLDWFFEQWIFKAGHPIFEVSYTWDENAKKLRLKVIQTQETSEWIPIFKTPVVIGITTASQKVSQKVWLEKKEELFDFDCEQKPLLVRFDEGDHLLKELTFCIFQNRLSRPPFPRARRGVEGARRFQAPGFGGIFQKCFEQDDSYLAQAEALRALGKCGDRSVIAFLQRVATMNSPRNVIRTAAQWALGEIEKK